MKVSLVIFNLLLLFSALLANPWSTAVLSEVWFADNGHLFVELYTPPVYITNYNQVQIAHGDTIACVTDSVEINFNNNIPYVVDVSELEPGLIFDPAGDTLRIRMPMGTEYYEMDGVSWGYGQYEIRPPLPGQSLVKAHPDYFTAMDIGWFKDEPPTPGLYPYNTVARDTIVILVTNTDGIPLQHFPLYLSDVYYICGYTNSSGIFVDTLKAGRLPVRLKHPDNNTVLYNQCFWLEPNETTFIPIEIDYQPTLNNDENVPPITEKGLRAYPTPCNLKTAKYLTFAFDGNTKLNINSHLKIYDTKGRYICRIPMSAKGTACWKPSRDISSGIYFARLINGNRILDTIPLTIVK